MLVSSGAGLIGMFGYSPYAPTKFALRGLAESLRGEVGPDGIEVSIVYPPDTDTPQLAAKYRTKLEETRHMTATARTWSADGVAACIVRGAARGRFAICPGWEMAALYRLHSLVGPLLQAHFARIEAVLATYPSSRQALAATLRRLVLTPDGPAEGTLSGGAALALRPG